VTPNRHPSALLRRIQPRSVRPREGESRRDAEIRWQLRNDPRICEALAGGCSKDAVARRVGVSKTAILGAVRRELARHGTVRP
jgi:hypothetical protein